MGIFHMKVMNRFTLILGVMQKHMMACVPVDLTPAELMALYVDPADYKVLTRANELVGRRGDSETVLANYEGRTVTLCAEQLWNQDDGFLFPKYMRGRRVLDAAPKATKAKLQAWVDASMEVACQFKYWMMALEHFHSYADNMEEILFFLPTLAFLMQVTREGNDRLGINPIPEGAFKNKGEWSRFVRQRDAVEKKLQPKRIPRMAGWIVDASSGADMALAQWRMVGETSHGIRPVRLTLTGNDTKLPSPEYEDALVSLLD